MTKSQSVNEIHHFPRLRYFFSKYISKYRGNQTIVEKEFSLTKIALFLPLFLGYVIKIPLHGIK